MEFVNDLIIRGQAPDSEGGGSDFEGVGGRFRGGPKEESASLTVVSSAEGIR